MQLSEATALVVDDEELICEIMAAWLKRHTREVLTAGNGQEALKVLGESHVDVIVSDVRMPVMDGISLVRAIAASATERPRVIFVTGFSDLQPRDAYNLGVEAIMEKPLEREHLLDAVKRSLASRNELWGRPLEISPENILEASFASLADAQRDEIAFGRGGFCLRTVHKLKEAPIRFKLGFQADNKIVSGEGIVRWISPAENLLGVEILYIDDQNRGWLADLAENKKLESYIPSAPNLKGNPAIAVAS